MCVNMLYIVFEWSSWLQSCSNWDSFKWDDDEVRFVLDQYAELDFYSASSLKQQSAVRHVVPRGHINLITSQPVFAFFAEKLLNWR
jgi:hypothetical protein